MKDSINNFTQKIKPFTRLICIVLISLILLGFWELSAGIGTKQPIKVLNLVVVGNTATTSTISINQSQTVIGSKNGTKYYFPWCGALNRIKPENRVEFATPELARASGYSPAGNCKGVR